MLFVLIAVSTALGGETNGSVEFTVTTKPTEGKYAPRHVFAVWVTDSEGNFVKTLKVLAKKRQKHLRTWAQYSQKNSVDAITGATQKIHSAHVVSWDCRDTEGNLMPDGEYQFYVEFADKNGQGPVTPPGHIQFKKGPKAISLKFEKLPYFDNMTLNYRLKETS